MSKPNILILGAGPAGVGAAYQLTKLNKANVTVLEMKDTPGGNSGSFYEEGLYLDYGSHRLHPACDEAILNDIKALLGDDLVLRPRHGRIRLEKSWIHFPLKASELATKLPISFSMGVGLDMVRSILPKAKSKDLNQENFATLLESKLGKTICREFYFPYAKKIWGLSPEKISVVQAEKRVSANSFAKLLKKVFSKPQNTGINGLPSFYYPKKGFGQITQALASEAEKYGANFIFNARVKKVETKNGTAHSVQANSNGKEHEFEADYIWSTLPVTGMVKGINPPADENLQKATNNIKFRSMVLIYLFIQQDRFTEFDAHYFPGEEIPITRLSETKNYSDTDYPENLTTICAELPCQFEDDVWNMGEEDLGKLVADSLKKAGIPVQSTVKKVVVKRLKHAYPIYNTGYEKKYQLLDDYLSGINNLLVFGRQGLFAHDNTHHALYTAYSAVDCIDDEGEFDDEKWEEYREEFKTHVVVD
ncbi:MAG: FAD-dependent oxidoreductase [Balneolaceae bacterium]|nr:FAD-dependent oxidoreductase [Balneolaceae bacterium]MDR9408898.1 FAD-dependent oxidoreductase [Balneolaceae bacterium]